MKKWKTKINLRIKLAKQFIYYLMLQPYSTKDTLILIDIFNLNIPVYFALHELDEFLSYLEIKSETYFCIYHDTKIVGGVGYDYKEEDKSGRINWIFVHPDFKEKGLGKEAVEFCIAKLKEDGRVEKLIVRTSQLAYKFFKSFDYKLLKTEKDYWATGLDLYLMEREK